MTPMGLIEDGTTARCVSCSVSRPRIFNRALALRQHDQQLLNTGSRWHNGN